MAMLYNLKDKILEKGYKVIQIMNEQKFEEQYDDTNSGYDIDSSDSSDDELNLM